MKRSPERRRRSCSDGTWQARERPYEAGRPRSPRMIREVEADPFVYRFDPARSALLMIDMQRDFIERGGFGESLGNDVSRLRAAVAPAARLLEASRAAGLRIV